MTHYINRIAAVTLALALSLSSQAAEYLGLDLGVQKKDAVIAQLTKVHANFESDYGYRGYKDLPMIKVNSFEPPTMSRWRSNQLSYSSKEGLGDFNH